jgi:2-oxoglutarate dehydrogenase E2 component (dihydrolipoamide succinyltransferase)
MAFELVMPKMGESIVEATIIKWHKKVGDPIALDETVLEIATDKVDSTVPSPVKGILQAILFPEDAVVPVGKAIAIIAKEGENITPSTATPASALNKPDQEVATTQTAQAAAVGATHVASSEGRFYAPLVKNIAKTEGITQEQLDSIAGSGANGRVTKRDVIAYLDQRSTQNSPAAATVQQQPLVTAAATPQTTIIAAPAVSMSGNVEIIEMDRMRKKIAEHMVMSKHVSPHVTSFVEADVTNIVKWRDTIKNEFQKRYNEKITFTPLFIEAVTRAIKDYPMINISVSGDKIVRKLDINIGMATALPSGNLIVPVIKNTDTLNLVGITKQVNDLADRARTGKLRPDDTQDGTFTLTNVGTFGNVMGTPIINQPQVAILATGAIRKKPAVLETEYGDIIAIRHMMFLSLSYDHRVVDGSLGGSFLRRIADYLEGFDATRTI